MRKLTQKWCFATLLENVPAGYEYFKGDWPLHITLAGMFTFAGRVELLEIAASLRVHKPFTAAVTGRGHLGPPEHPVPVSFIDMESGLAALHTALVTKLLKRGAVFDTPEYQLEGFTAHSSDQKHKQLTTGRMISINNAALIDMLPYPDSDIRKIVSVAAFSEPNQNKTRLQKPGFMETNV